MNALEYKDWIEVVLDKTLDRFKDDNWKFQSRYRCVPKRVDAITICQLYDNAGHATDNRIWPDDQEPILPRSLIVTVVVLLSQLEGSLRKGKTYTLTSSLSCFSIFLTLTVTKVLSSAQKSAQASTYPPSNSRRALTIINTQLITTVLSSLTPYTNAAPPTKE